MTESPTSNIESTPSNPTGVVGAATVGIITVLVRELVRSGALDAKAFVAEIDGLAAMPLQAPQSAEETRLEQRVFELVRLAANTAQRGAL